MREATQDLRLHIADVFGILIDSDLVIRTRHLRLVIYMRYYLLRLPLTYKAFGPSVQFLTTFNGPVQLCGLYQSLRAEFLHLLSSTPG